MSTAQNGSKSAHGLSAAEIRCLVAVYKNPGIQGAALGHKFLNIRTENEFGPVQQGIGMVPNRVANRLCRKKVCHLDSLKRMAGEKTRYGYFLTEKGRQIIRELEEGA